MAHGERLRVAQREHKKERKQHFRRGFSTSFLIPCVGRHRRSNNGRIFFFFKTISLHFKKKK